MNIELPPAQRKWLDAQVANGDFASVDEAVQQIIAERMAIEADDFAWAKPWVEEARVSVANGDVMGVDEHRVRMAKRLKALEP
jgi:antitoxin ParD1/3/4